MTIVGESSDAYTCEADRPWLKEAVEPSVCQGLDLCYDVTLSQPLEVYNNRVHGVPNFHISSTCTSSKVLSLLNGRCTLP